MQCTLERELFVYTLVLTMTLAVLKEIGMQLLNIIRNIFRECNFKVLPKLLRRFLTRPWIQDFVLNNFNYFNPIYRNTEE